MALHDCDGDLNRAVNDLLEGVSPEWEVKKKKARQSGGPKQNSEQSGVPDSNADWEDKRTLYNNDGSSRVRGGRGGSHNSRGCKLSKISSNKKNALQYVKIIFLFRASTRKQGKREKYRGSEE